MAIDPNPATASTDIGPSPVIENEIPDYRAISGLAVSSLVMGLVSLLAFADLRFLAVAAGAVVLGLLALRKIDRFPKILTGTGMARTGIALGAVFAVSSVTANVSSNLLLKYNAGQFAKHYGQVLKDQSLGNAIWYQQSPEYRKSKSPAELLAELQKAKGPSGSDVFEERTAAVRRLKARLAGKDQEVHYSQVESSFSDGLTQYVNVRLDVDGPGTKDFPEKEEFALLEMILPQGGGQSDWMIKDIKYPYTPSSLVATPLPKKSDDGHGHGH